MHVTQWNSKLLRRGSPIPSPFVVHPPSVLEGQLAGGTVLGFYSDFQSVGTSSWDFGKYGCYRCRQQDGGLSHGSVDVVVYVASFGLTGFLEVNTDHRSFARACEGL